MRHAVVFPVKCSCVRLIVVAILFSGRFRQPIRQERECGQTERWTGECTKVAKVVIVGRKSKFYNENTENKENSWAKEMKIAPLRWEEVTKQKKRFLMRVTRRIQVISTALGSVFSDNIFACSSSPSLGFFWDSDTFLLFLKSFSFHHILLLVSLTHKIYLHRCPALLFLCTVCHVE